MDPASILTFLTFAGSTSDLIFKTTKTIYQAPVEILSLNNELNDLQLVLIELQSFQQNSPRRPDVAGPADHFDAAFEKCFERIRQLFERISELTSTVFTQRPNGRHSFERFAWARRKSSVLSLKQELSIVRQALRDLIETRTASRITNIEIALGNLSAISPSALPSAQISDNASGDFEKDAIAGPLDVRSGLQQYEKSLKALPPTSTVAFEAFRRAQCDIRCPCPCHSRRRYLNSSLAGSLFGSLFTLEVAFGSNYFGEPEFNIRLHNRVEYTIESSLFQLARKGDVDQMRKKLSDRQASPHDVTVRGGVSAFDWALHYLGSTGDVEPCKVLIDAGIDLHLEDDHGSSNAFNATHTLLSPKKKESVAKLADLLSFIDIPTLWDMPHLHQVTVGLRPLDLETEIKKLSHRTHVNALDIKRRTALHWAALRGDLKAMQLLLLAGADRNAADIQGETPLFFAVSSGSVECVELLLLGDAKIDSMDWRGQRPMLIAAWAVDSPEMIRVLANAGGDVTCCNESGVSVLQSAACLNHPKNVETFLELGADVNAFDQNGDTALFECIYHGCMETMKVLGRQPVDRYHSNRKGWSLLHVLAMYGNAETLFVLQHLLPGIDVSFEDESGRTALEALNSRTDGDAKFATMFKATLHELGETGEEVEDDASVMSFDTAVEEQDG